MSFYFIAFIQEVRDPAGLQQYAALAAETLRKSKAVRLAAGLGDAKAVEMINQHPGTDPVATCERLEGAPVTGMSLIKFPDKASFENWYYSVDYQRALKIREAAAVTQVMLIEGV